MDQATLRIPFDLTFIDPVSKMPYATGEQVVSRLIDLLGVGGWQFRVGDPVFQPDIANPEWVFVKGRLDVSTKVTIDTNQPFMETRCYEQFGGAKIKRLRDGNIMNIGDDVKAAATDALKKCASLIGVGLWLMERDESRGDVIYWCQTCGEKLEDRGSLSAKEIHDRSMAAYGASSCIECGRKAKALEAGK